ncbi:MAG: 3-phosphoshikimate 1-carboxyvinyltransferase [Phycisphaeraceae bacterium]|nr:3-phosphoshikimate 1-carboxyvinyltransferase [Phycisphaeraceae bacterium]
MPRSITIEPLAAFEASICPPGSKSLTNRALLLSALAEGRSIIRRPLWADDTRRMVEALRRIGFDLDADEDRIEIEGGAVRSDPGAPIRLDLGNSGTSIRSLAAACCLWPGRFTLDGIERMRRRPIGELVDALRQLGASIAYEADDGFPPLTVDGGSLNGGEVEIGPMQSSQYVTALLMIGPRCGNGLSLRIGGAIPSRPYVVMTLGLMQRFGAEVDADAALTRIDVKSASCRAIEYEVEPDASSASYFLALAAVIPGSKCTITGLGRRSLQGDVGIADVLHQMGASILFGPDFLTVMAPPDGARLKGVDVDLNAMPDMAMTLAAAALFADGPTTIRNVPNLRIKETDRMAALDHELTKLGARVRIDGGDLHIEAPSDGDLRPADIDTYDDHRIAMSFAVAAAASPARIAINDPDCVSKTYPGFFDDLEALRRM